MEGFYGFEVHAGQPAVKAAVPDGCIFRLMQVALPAGATEPITLRVAVDKQSPLVLLTLNPKSAQYQSSMDSVFSAKQSARFTADGAGSLHVCGYIQPAVDADDDFFDADGEEDDEDYGSDIYFGDEEEEAEEGVPLPSAKSAKTAKGQSASHAHESKPRAPKKHK